MKGDVFFKNQSNLNIIKSSTKVFDVLEVIVKHKTLSITEISDITKYTKSTTQRIVNTLNHLEYINQNTNTLEYYPSMKLYEMGMYIMDHMPIKNISRPHLMKLYYEINETVNLGILNGDNVVYLDKLVSTSPLRVELELGIQIPIYGSALGKAIAAFINNHFTFEGNYIKNTKNTISSDKELYKELELVRKRGYAIDNEEHVEGLICVAVPILNKEGFAVASISISRPTIRNKPYDIEYYVELLKNCANKISRELY